MIVRGYEEEGSLTNQFGLVKKRLFQFERIFVSYVFNRFTHVATWHNRSKFYFVGYHIGS